jgi:6-phosphogluconate dehydrogenase
MKLAMYGLGKMGGAMARRLVRGGHEVVAYNRSEPAVAQAEAAGAIGARSPKEAIDKLSVPKIVWFMLPSGKVTGDEIDAVSAMLSAGDIIIDGGNSHYTDTVIRAKVAALKGLHFIDVGTSGGVWGEKEGYSMMVGGEKDIADFLQPAFMTLAPAPDKGWGYVGPSGSGHFTKMVHNGIEYGMMEAYAEGLDLIHRKTEFNVNLQELCEIWRYGSVVRSWLLDLAADALKTNPGMDGIAPWVPDSGEGRWTVTEAIDQACPLPVITLALQRRFMSRDEESFAEKLLSMLRHEFGGHDVKQS